MSKQYLQTLTIPAAHPTDIFGLASTPTHLLTISGSSSIKIHRTSNRAIHADSAEDEDPYPLAQTLDKVHKLGCHHICAAAEGQVAASVGFAGEVKIWKVQTPAEDESEGGSWAQMGEISVDPKQSTGSYWAPALSPDGAFLALTTLDGRIDVYETAKASPPAANGEGSSPSDVAKFVQYETKGSFGMSVDISPNGELTASGHQNGGVYLFANATQRLTYALAGLLQPVRSVKFSPASRYLAAAGDARVIALYDTASGQQVANLTGHASWITSLAWNWSGELLLSGSYDGKVKVWSIERRDCVATQTENDGKALWAVQWLYHAPSARNEVFVTAGAGRTLAFYREASGT